MSFFNTRYNYGWLTIFLHFLLFFMIVGMVASGSYSDSLPKGEKIPQLIANHKQIGVAVLVLMLFRLLWRIINPSVGSFSTSVFIRFVAWLNHWLLYIVIIAQATCGIMMSQASGRMVNLFGLPVPTLTDFLSDDLNFSAPLLRQWHDYGGRAIIALVVLHFIGAMMHRFVWSDDTLRRMWFTYRPSYKNSNPRKR